MRFEAVEVLLKSLGANLHQHLHVYLGLERVRRESSSEFRVLEAGANTLLLRRSVDLAVKGASNAKADPFLADAVGADDYEESTSRLVRWSSRHRYRFCIVTWLCLDKVWTLANELNHPLSCSFSLSLLPRVRTVNAIFAEADTHLAARFDHVFLAGEWVLGSEIGGVKIAHIDLLLNEFSWNQVDRVGPKKRVLYVSRTSSKVSAVKDALEFWRLAGAQFLFKQEKRTPRTMIRGYHCHMHPLCIGNFSFLFEFKVDHPFRIDLELLSDEVRRDAAAVDMPVTPRRGESDVMITMEMTQKVGVTSLDSSISESIHTDEQPGKDFVERAGALVGRLPPRRHLVCGSGRPRCVFCVAWHQFRESRSWFTTSC
jgi:hypothetical protein